MPGIHWRKPYDRETAHKTDYRLHVFPADCPGRDPERFRHPELQEADL